MLQIYKRLQYLVTVIAKYFYTFNLFIILHFRLELMRPPDVISRGRHHLILPDSILAQYLENFRFYAFEHICKSKICRMRSIGGGNVLVAEEII